MLTEETLKINQKYLYKPASKKALVEVTFEGKREVRKGVKVLVFRLAGTMNEVWVDNLDNIFDVL